MAGLVVIEGIDGCGKSTVAKMLVSRLGKRAVLTREPTDSWIGKAVRRGDRKQVSPYTDALLFMADRAEHTVEIRRLIRAGKLVVSDRYYHSTVAYQAAFLEKAYPGDAFKWLLEANLRISLKPDLTIFLDIPPSLGLERARGRGEFSRFERLDFLKKVRSNYKRLSEADRSIVEVDGTQPVAEVVEHALDLISRRNI
jgi:dTMP kinase